MWNNQSKTTATYSNLSKDSASFRDTLKGGQGWLYNQALITYNMDIDPHTGNPVYYNGVGKVTTWSNLSK